MVEKPHQQERRGLISLQSLASVALVEQSPEARLGLSAFSEEKVVLSGGFKATTKMRSGVSGVFTRSSHRVP